MHTLFAAENVPAPLFMAAQTAVAAILICTTPKSSFLRPASLPILIALMYLSWKAAPAFTLQGVLYSFWWVGPYANIYHCLNNLCLHPLDDEAIRHEMRLQHTPLDLGLFNRVIFTIGMLFSFRGIGTSHQISYIPPFPGNVVPSRSRFLLRQCSLIMAQYLIMDLMASSPPPPDVVDSWAAGKEWLWIRSLNPHPVTLDDLHSRLIGCVMNWYVLGRVMNDIWYRVFSVVCVGLRISEPKQWPPCYGHYSDTATLRGYFGKFWHQTLRWPFHGVASFISRQVLGLPRGSASRYANLFIVFFLSGSLHSILDVAFGGRWYPAGGLLCFSVFLPAGIMFEDGVQWIWRRYFGPRKEGGWMGRIIGHLWVVFYLALVTPVFNYPLQRIEGNPTHLVPWSLVQSISASG
ncbi:membrane bound O-acyl transferase family-domain-containing protein [Aspergillus terricola var. indicus]